MPHTSRRKEPLGDKLMRKLYRGISYNHGLSADHVYNIAKDRLQYDEADARGLRDAMSDYHRHARGAERAKQLSGTHFVRKSVRQYINAPADVKDIAEDSLKQRLLATYGASNWASAQRIKNAADQGRMSAELSRQNVVSTTPKQARENELHHTSGMAEAQSQLHGFTETLNRFGRISTQAKAFMKRDPYLTAPEAQARARRHLESDEAAAAAVARAVGRGRGQPGRRQAWTDAEGGMEDIGTVGLAPAVDHIASTRAVDRRAYGEGSSGGDEHDHIEGGTDTVLDVEAVDDDQEAVADDLANAFGDVGLGGVPAMGGYTNMGNAQLIPLELRIA